MIDKDCCKHKVLKGLKLVEDQETLILIYKMKTFQSVKSVFVGLLNN